MTSLSEKMIVTTALTFGSIYLFTSTLHSINNILLKRDVCNHTNLLILNSSIYSFLQLPKTD